MKGALGSRLFKLGNYLQAATCPGRETSPRIRISVWSRNTALQEQNHTFSSERGGARGARGTNDRGGRGLPLPTYVHMPTTTLYIAFSCLPTLRSHTQPPRASIHSFQFLLFPTCTIFLRSRTRHKSASHNASLGILMNRVAATNRPEFTYYLVECLLFRLVVFWIVLTPRFFILFNSCWPLVLKQKPVANNMQIKYHTLRN